MKIDRWGARLCALVLLSSGLVAISVAPPAAAADECGSGWHRQSDGKMSGSKSLSAHGRTVTASVSGYVRFCTRERRGRPDQRNQRVILAVPSRLKGTGAISGKHTRICLEQTIVAQGTPALSGYDIGISGGSGGVGVSMNFSYAPQKATMEMKKCEAKDQISRINFWPVATVTADNGPCTFNVYPPHWNADCYMGPFITSVTITTRVTAEYRTGHTDQVVPVEQVEVDYSGKT
jgi:hypothetical protein